MDKKKSFLQKLTITDKVALVILLFGIVGMFVLPYLITKTSWCFDLGVDDSNEIGDTLGGILSPFIGLISAFLVYLALRSQIEANNIIKGQFEQEKESKEDEMLFEKTYTMLNDLIDSLNNFSYEGHKGVSAFFEFMTGEFLFLTLRSKNHLDKKLELLNTMEDINQIVIFFLEHPRFNESFRKIFYFRYLKIVYFFSSIEISDFKLNSENSITQELYRVNVNFKKLYDLVSIQKGIREIDFSYLDKLKKDLYA